MGWVDTLIWGYGMGRTYWWIHRGYGMPHQPSSSGLLYGQDRSKVSARIVKLYVIVMTDAKREFIIVIRADDNLDSRDRTDMGNRMMIYRSGSSMHVNDMELLMDMHTYI